MKKTAVLNEPFQTEAHYCDYKTIKNICGVFLGAIRLKANNSMMEARNARIQRLKKTACGYRNKERFKTAILFHLGGLELMPCST